MSDILIKNNRLRIANGDFVQVSGLEEIKQKIVVALNTMRTDWVLNPYVGIDYVRGLRNEEFLEDDVKNQIKNVDGVVSITKFQREFDRKTFSTKISAIISTVYGNIEISEVITQ